MVFLTEKPLKGSGRFTNARTSPASNVARVSGGSYMVEDQPTGVRVVSEDNNEFPLRSERGSSPTVREGVSLIVIQAK